MAHTGLFCSSTEITSKAGVNYDSTGVSEAIINEWCLEIENLINVLTRYNSSDKFTATETTATLSPDVWHLLGQVESDLVAIYCIESNMRGLTATPYPSRIVAEDMINVLRDRALFCIGILRDKKVQTFMVNA